MIQKWTVLEDAADLFVAHPGVTIGLVRLAPRPEEVGGLQVPIEIVVNRSLLLEQTSELRAKSDTIQLRSGVLLEREIRRSLHRHVLTEDVVETVGVLPLVVAPAPAAENVRGGDPVYLCVEATEDNLRSVIAFAVGVLRTVIDTVFMYSPSVYRVKSHHDHH